MNAVRGLASILLYASAHRILPIVDKQTDDVEEVRFAPSRVGFQYMKSVRFVCYIIYFKLV